MIGACIQVGVPSQTVREIIKLYRLILEASVADDVKATALRCSTKTLQVKDTTVRDCTFSVQQPSEESDRGKHENDAMGD